MEIWIDISDWWWTCPVICEKVTSVSVVGRINMCISPWMSLEQAWHFKANSVCVCVLFSSGLRLKTFLQINDTTNIWIGPHYLHSFQHNLCSARGFHSKLIDVCVCACGPASRWDNTVNSGMLACCPFPTSLILFNPSWVISLWLYCLSFDPGHPLSVC